MPAIPPTEVMTLGSLGAGISSVSPSWRYNFLNPPPTTPQASPNILAQTIQGLSAGGVGMVKNADGSITLSPTDQATLQTVGAVRAVAMLALAGLVGGVAAVHGYRRHHGSTGWGWTWGIAGTLFPPAALSLALIQGFGKPARK